MQYQNWRSLSSCYEDFISLSLYLLTYLYKCWVWFKTVFQSIFPQFLLFLFLQFKSSFLGEWSLDRISLDIFSWSKFSVKLGVWLKLFFFLVSWSNFTWSFQLMESSKNGILAIKKFQSSAKICKLFFGSWLKVLIMVFWAFYQLSIKCQNPWVLFWQLIKCTVG